METLENSPGLSAPDVGVLMLETTFTRLVGDIGNPQTWPFPVRFRIIEGAKPTRIVRPIVDPELLPAFVAAARELESEGVRVITTSCGFLAAFQAELAAAVSVPVFTSSLLHIPQLNRVLNPEKQTLVLAASPDLGEASFAGIGAERDERVVVRGFPPTSQFARVYVHGAKSPNVDEIRDEVVQFARTAITENPQVGAIVLECTNLSPFADEIREATGLPVNDLVGLVRAFQATLPPRLAKAFSQDSKA